ncbi:hypothetical protein ACFL6Y_11470 [Elusimicrobiota bacterium]
MKKEKLISASLALSLFCLSIPAGAELKSETKIGNVQALFDDSSSSALPKRTDRRTKPPIDVSLEQFPEIDMPEQGVSA